MWKKEEAHLPGIWSIADGMKVSKIFAATFHLQARIATVGIVEDTTTTTNHQDVLEALEDEAIATMTTVIMRSPPQLVQQAMQLLVVQADVDERNDMTATLTRKTLDHHAVAGALDASLELARFSKVLVSEVC